VIRRNGENGRESALPQRQSRRLQRCVKDESNDLVYLDLHSKAIKTTMPYHCWDRWHQKSGVSLKMGEVSMSDEKTRPAWSQIVITALITAFLSLAVGILLYHYTSKTGDLVSEVFPPAHFDKQTTRVSIYNAHLENAGRKEAEDVHVYFELPASCHIQDMKVEPSLKSIAYTIAEPQPHIRTVTFPLLNPGDKSRFSILVDQGEVGPIKVEVRGKGLTGHAGPADDRPTTMAILSVSTAFLALIGALTGILSTWFAKFRSERQIGDIVQTQRSRLDKEIQFIRTQGKPAADVFRAALLGTKYRLFFNPKIPGLSKTKIMKFGEDGRILEGQNRNESSWRIRSDFLELVDEQGNVHSRFYYSSSDGRFYQTNDADNGSISKHGIRDQYMIPEE